MCYGNVLSNAKKFIEKGFKRKPSIHFRKAESERGYYDRRLLEQHSIRRRAKII